MPTHPPHQEDQAPLGLEPAYDDVLDVGIEYTFPCSDPIAVGTCCSGIARRETLDEPGAPNPAGQPRQ
jgi:hypothetical protein